MKLKRIQLLIGNHPTEEAVFAERHFLQLSGKRDAAELLKGTTNCSIYGTGLEAKMTLMSPFSHELLSMIMYAIELNPLLTRLAEGLQGLKTRSTSSNLSVFAYADDITIILASPADVEADRTALLCTYVPTCCSCQSQPYQIQSPITGQMNTEMILWTFLTSQKRQFWASDSMRLSRIRPGARVPVLLHTHTHTHTHTHLTRCSARLRYLNLLQRVRYVSIFQFSRLRYLPHASPANTRRRAASHEQCHRLVLMER